MIQFKDVAIAVARLNMFSPIPAGREWELTGSASVAGVQLVLTVGGPVLMDLLSDRHHVIDLPWTADLSCDGLYAAIRDVATSE